MPSTVKSMTCKPKGKEDKQMKNKKKASWGSLLRLLDYMWKQYKFVLLLAAVLIVTASLSTVYITFLYPGLGGPIHPTHVG